MSYKCNLVLPGFPKSGTSSLHVYLDMHPEISMSQNKEPHFFNDEEKYQSGPSGHNDLFGASSSAKLYGESSTTYCISELACKRISESLRQPKIIFLMRDPVQRTLSHYKWLCALGHESRPLSEAIEGDGYGFEFRKNWGGNFKSYLQFSQYQQYVPMWQKEFGHENVLLLSTEQLAESPNATLEKVWGFLDVEPIDINQPVTSNKTSDIRARKLPSWIFALGKCFPESFRRYVRESNGLYEKLKGLLGKDLAHQPVYTNKDIEQLENLLEQDVTFYRRTFLQ